MSPFDTIVAPITGSQPAAVAIVRVSGPEAWLVASEVFSPWPAEPESHKAVYGRYRTGDDGLALPFSEGHSYTGDQAVELSCHGSPASVRALVEACIKSGARHAEPGEFTQRAFLNGRLDLTEAEAVADTVQAQTDAQLRIANLQREGALHKEVSALRDRVLKILAAVEASVDFEEEIGPLDRDSALKELEDLKVRIETLLRTARLGHIMRRGLRIAIVGPPNAGKSSLFNALVGRERAIVTPIPGTTRDYVEEQIDMGGVPVVLIDTAGIRETEDVAEAMGVQRTHSQMAHADMTWFVFDASLAPDNVALHQARSASNWTHQIGNKSDIAGEGHGDAHTLVSAKTGAGMESLVDLVSRYAEEAKGLEVPPIAERHEPLLTLTRAALVDAATTIQQEQPDDLLSTLLRSAANHLGEITGETASADMIERIFADFCIGK
ncbi:MAG: tRNA modification GTPase [Fimbriimonadaceae bacterium]|jgi:tRNA modification GTPase|nr:tRNA modification GTPase [Fimbriimonadaceae bacterium]